MTASSNLDLVRSILADCERGDFHSTKWAEPEVEYVIADGPAPGRWTGLADMEEGARQYLRGWAELRALADAYRELDDERVLVLTRRSGRGKASGLELERLGTRGATIFHVRDGKVTRHVMYYDRDRAFADLGLEESSGS